MFAYRLALATGRLDVDEILAAMTSRQLAEWHAFYRQQPFGQDHSDFLVAQMTAMLDNRWRGKNEQPIKPDDLLPKPGGQEEQTPEMMRGILQGVLGAI